MTDNGFEHDPSMERPSRLAMYDGLKTFYDQQILRLLADHPKMDTGVFVYKDEEIKPLELPTLGADSAVPEMVHLEDSNFLMVDIGIYANGEPHIAPGDAASGEASYPNYYTVIMGREVLPTAIQVDSLGPRIEVNLTDDTNKHQLSDVECARFLEWARSYDGGEPLIDLPDPQ